MASERDQALNSIVPGDTTLETIHPKLETALEAAEQTRRLELQHNHEINRLKAELGWFGRVFGSESHAAMVIAFVAVFMGFVTAIGLWALAYYTGHTETWSTEAHFALGAATSALGYVFGRGSKDGSK